LHRANTGGYLIARHELTFGEWMGWLDRLSEAEARPLVPLVQTASGSVRVERSAATWVLHLRPSSIEYLGDRIGLIRYADRATHRNQKVNALPVSGISAAQVEMLLRRLGPELGGQRLCTEAEWERAARGADGRSFTVGDRLDPNAANVDVTYGRRAGGYGPDQVGEHPESDSPFGLSDLQGNAFEIVRSNHDDAAFVEKGGSWYHDMGIAGRLSSRFPLESATRSVTLGARLCMDAGGYNDN
jgi:hypothetical protein